MIENLKIIVLVENTVRRPGLMAEHGLSFWIEADGRRILFDTGQGQVLRHNADRLEVPLDQTDVVAISHGHFDHTGGLDDCLAVAQNVDLYLHPGALVARYRKEKSSAARFIGMANANEDSLRSRVGRLVWTREPVEIANGIHLTGEIPRQNDFEDTGGAFYLDPACERPDPIVDDQAMYVETPKGIVVILGCAHSGVVNTLDYIARLTGQDRMYAVLGGTHLLRATAKRLEATIDAFSKYGLCKIGAAHCTGMRATTQLWSTLPDACFECCAGTTFRLA